jgi:hypothetical protein
MSRPITVGQFSTARFVGNSANVSPIWLAAGATQVEDVRGHHRACDYTPLQNAGGQLLGIVKLVINQVPIGLDDDAVPRSPEVENLVGARFSPSSTGCAGV